MTPIRQEIDVPGAGAPISHYCDAVVHGNTVYVSGILALDADGALAGDGDVEAQAERVFARLNDVLAAAGARYADILKVTLYLTDINDRALINPVRKRWFGAHRPASTLVQVSKLAVPGARLEVEAIAQRAV
ncbi:RidA family protein [Caballeronia sp. LZ043]|uniref:RidA family protein n=1 Tax=Caballeronia sp. LZ043 TaxID=3038569 RepID=UPI00285E0729|nr:RidA family protein [Caballeronia sp. LZ043]MDR5822463.1 RidA family protein [Caballeronia sp. LZ043]